MLSLHPILRQAAFVACLLLTGPSAAFGSHPDLELGVVLSSVDAQALTLLRSVRGSGLHQPAAVARELRELGPEAIERLLKTLKEGRVPASTDSRGSSRKLKELQAEALLDALGNFGRKAVMPRWSALFQDTPESHLTPSVRIAAVRALGSFGVARDLDRLWALAKNENRGASTDLSSAMGRTLELATASILKRDRAAFVRLEASWSRLPSSWHDEIVRAVGLTRDATGLGVFRRMVFVASDQQRLIASQIPLMGASNDPGINEELAQALSLSLQSESKADVQAAALALAHLEVPDVVPDLIELLKDGRSGVPENAHRALCVLTNTSLVPNHPTWRRWYQQEVAWRRDEQQATLQRLDSRDAVEVQSALREISKHRLERHQLAVEVSRTLHSQHESVRLMATTVLAELGSRWGLEGLVSALSDSTESVRGAAHAALVRLTGTDRGTAAEDWQDFELPGRRH